MNERDEHEDGFDFDILTPHPSFTALDALIEMFEEEDECENDRSAGS